MNNLLILNRRSLAVSFIFFQDPVLIPVLIIQVRQLRTRTNDGSRHSPHAVRPREAGGRTLEPKTRSNGGVVYPLQMWPPEAVGPDTEESYLALLTRLTVWPLDLAF